MAWKRLPQAAPAALAIAVVVPSLAGGQGFASDRSPRAVPIVERDFSISSPKTLHPGGVVLRVRNTGPDTHELLIVRGSSLPLRRDGLTVDEESVGSRLVGSLDGTGPGHVRQLRVHLTPGRYVLFCNMAGHYLGGMHTELIVR